MDNIGAGIRRDFNVNYNNAYKDLMTNPFKFGKKHRGFAIALGLIFTVFFHYTNKYFIEIKEDVSSNTFMFIIIISSIIMAVIPIVTMVAATLGVHELVDLNKNAFAIKKEYKSNENKGNNEK